MEPKFSPPSKGGISGLKVIFFFPLLPLGAIVGGVVDFFLCKRGGEAGKQGFSANEKKAWRKIWLGFFFDCSCNGHGAHKGKKKTTFNPDIPPFQHLVGVSPIAGSTVSATSSNKRLRSETIS